MVNFILRNISGFDLSLEILAGTPASTLIANQTINLLEYVSIPDAVSSLSNGELRAAVSSGRISLIKNSVGFLKKSECSLRATYDVRSIYLYVTPTAASFSFSQQTNLMGDLSVATYTKSAPEILTISHGSVASVFLVYYDESTLAYKNLSTDTSPITFSDMNKTEVCYLWYTATGSVYLFDLRQDLREDWVINSLTSQSQQIKFKSGLQIINPNLVPGQVVISSGQLVQNTSIIDVVAQSPLDAHILYRNDIAPNVGSNNWCSDINSGSLVGLVTGPFNKLMYNKLTTVWSTQEVTDSYFVAYWVVGTSSADNPIMLIMGQGQYSSLSEAKYQSSFEKLSFDNVLVKSFRPLFRIILQQVPGIPYTPSVVDITDIRNDMIVGDYVVTGSSAGSSGLAGSIATDTSGFNGILSAADTDVQLALDTIDEHTHAPAGFSNYLYVDINGNDATGERGNSALPYLTIQAALNVALSGDIIKVGPGTFSEQIIFPELASISIIGSGKERTQIVYGTLDVNDHTVVIAPTASEIENSTIADITIYNPGFGRALYVSGIDFAAFNSGTLILDNIDIRSDSTGGCRCISVGQVKFSNCRTDRIQLYEVGICHMFDVQCSELFEPRCSGGEIPPTSGYSDITCVGCDFAGTDVTYDVKMRATGCNLGAATTMLGVYGGYTYLDVDSCAVGNFTITANGRTSSVWSRNPDYAVFKNCSFTAVRLTRLAGPDTVVVSAPSSMIPPNSIMVGADCFLYMMTAGGTCQYTYSSGDILYGSAITPNTLDKLPIGDNGYVLTSTGTSIEWAPATGSSGDVGFSATLYVDVNGEDSTAERGNAGKPYQTVGAAISASISGDTIKIGPGTFAEAIILPEYDELYIIGSGKDVTILEASSEDAIVYFVPTSSTMNYCTISDLTINNTSLSGLGICINGASVPTNPGVFIPRVAEPYANLKINNVRCVSGGIYDIFIQCAGAVELNNITSYKVQLNEVDNCSVYNVSNAILNQLVSRFDEAETLPYTYPVVEGWSFAHCVRIFGCDLSIVELYNSASLEAWGSNLDYVAATMSSVTLTPQIRSNSYLGEMFVDIDTTNSAPATTFLDISGANVYSLALTHTAGTERVRILANNTTFQDRVLIGVDCDAIIHGAGFDCSLFQVELGATITPETTITPDGGLATLMVNKTGNNSIKGQILQHKEDSWEIVGNEYLTNFEVSSYSEGFPSMTGTDCGRIYLILNLNMAGDAQVDGYLNSDLDPGHAIFSGSVTGSGTVTVTELNGSGFLSGTIDVIADWVPNFTAYADLGFSKGVETIRSVMSPKVGKRFAGIMYSDGFVDGENVWVVIYGKAYILTASGASNGGFLYAGGAGGTALCELVRSQFDTSGIARSLERVTSGLVLSELDMIGDGPVIMA